MPTRVTATEIRWEVKQALVEADKKDKTEVAEALSKIIVFIDKPKPVPKNMH